ncbi:MAG: GIY-YIG nuclease family protein [Gemmatimonadota bacterium]
MSMPVVYILTNRKNGTLYVGVTTRLAERLTQHRAAAVGGFTRRYGLTMLVHFEMHATIADARLREARLKKWRRSWKIALIEDRNPSWRDLSGELPLGL